MEFEWEDYKADENLQKHGIDFLDATCIFLDPHRLDVEDDREDYGERRFKTIGRVQDRVIVVVYTYAEQHTRIISARKAEPYERRKYHEGETGP